jgi:hypothetical protein
MLNRTGVSDSRSMACVAVVVLGLTLAACRGGGGSRRDGGAYDGGAVLGPSGAGGASADKFETLVHAICDYYRRCCQASGRSIEPLVDCEMTLLEDPNEGAFVRRGNVQLVEPAYSQCLSEIGTASCGAIVERNACIEVFQGTVPAGGECLIAAECARNGQPVACVRGAEASDDDLGVCRPLSPARAGEPCLLSFQSSTGVVYPASDPGDDSSPLGYCNLDQGLFCDLSDQVCVQLLPLGAPCDDDDCALDLHCDGTCKPAKPTGSACTEHDECGATAWCPEGTCRDFTIVDLDICDGDLD